MKDLDLLRKRVTVVENAVQVNMTMHVGTPKSDKSRSVPIPGFVVVELARQCEGKARDDLVFPSRDGDYLKRSVSFTGWFTKAVDRSGVPRLTPHDLRHTCASLSIAAGANVKALQRMLGHASASMTLDTLQRPVRRRSRHRWRRSGSGRISTECGQIVGTDGLTDSHNDTKMPPTCISR